MTNTMAMTATPAPAEPAVPQVRRPTLRKRRLYIASAVIGVYVIAALVGPLLVQYDAVATAPQDRLMPPGSILSSGDRALLGTDSVGRDIFAQILQGARISIMVGVASLALAGSIGITIGVVAGYFGRKADAILMRLADIQLTFPSVLLAIFIAAMIGPSVRNVIIVLGVSNWVGFARVARAQVLSNKGRDFVDASRTLGARHWHLLRRCILPACFAPLMVVATVELGSVILAEASLSFLGLGTPQTTPSWGLTIANGRDYLGSAWWISTMPGIALALLVVAFGTRGDELRDRFDPKLKNL
jgi:peptide/nickel transport system permease protein